MLSILQKRRLEDMCIMMVQEGKVKNQITDAMLKQMLESVSDGVRIPPETRARAPCMRCPAHQRL